MNNSLEALIEHYTRQDEGGRLARTGHGQLELLRTRDLLSRHLPAPPSRILDVGGATGIHAKWLAERGYEVHLVDPVPAHVDSARELGGFTAEIGDARSLAEPDQAADAVLLLGPLYHLIDRSDRLTVLAEAWRTLRPGGVVCAAAISRYMSLLAHCAAGELSDDRLNLLLPTLATGRHDPAVDFMEAYFHEPEELERELKSSQFENVRVLGVEGPAWMAADAAGADAKEVLESALLCARALETDETIRAVSAHYFGIGYRPHRGSDSTPTTLCVPPL